ncbi:MAG: DUF1284 domain-containing protein [Alphaproteobacteria bacterium]|nr:DUF1284 domain-containing protein [Alphaproteobacteria bacterium]
MTDAVRLRWHHVLCILNHGGDSHTPAHAAHIGRIIRKIEGGAAIKITAGADDICGGFAAGDAIRCNHAMSCDRNRTLRMLDQWARADICAALQIPALQAGGDLVLKTGEIKQLRLAYAAGRARTACGACRWKDACAEMAGKNYQGARLWPDAVPGRWPFVASLLP